MIYSQPSTSKGIQFHRHLCEKNNNRTEFENTYLLTIDLCFTGIFQKMMT